MYFKIIKSNKTTERVFLEEHPLVHFINSPMDRVFITDGLNLRDRIVDTKCVKMDIVDRLYRENNIKNKMFVIYAPDENDIYTIAYEPYSFEAIKYIRFAEIAVSPAEWKYMMKDKLKEREEAYQEFLFDENKSSKNYKFLLIGR